MTPDISEIWVYLSASPLLWLTLTCLAYAFGDFISRHFGRSPLANPVVIAAAILVAILIGTGTAYPAYFEGAQFVHFLLGPATVALAVPLWRNRVMVRKSIVPMAAAILAGSITASLSAVGIAWLLGADYPALASISVKSVTAPIAMELARSLGGIPELAAVLVIATGITGAVIVTPLMNFLGIRNFAARGFAAGVASHGIGTARAFQVSETAGAFAGIAMGLNGVLTSLLVLIWIAFMR